LTLLLARLSIYADGLSSLALGNFILAWRAASFLVGFFLSGPHWARAAALDEELLTGL